MGQHGLDASPRVHHFALAPIRNLEAMIRKLAVDCLEAARDKGEIDVLGDFASQISVKVACTVTGIPLEDGEMLNDLVWRFFKREPGIDGMTPDGIQAMKELSEYFKALSRSRRKSGSDEDDVVNLLNEVEIDGEKLVDDAIASHLSMFIIGGAETFPKVFANAIRRLAEHPDQRAECAADPDLTPSAFQEALRFDMPTQFLCRMVTKPVEYHGQTLKPGQPVLYPNQRISMSSPETIRFGSTGGGTPNAAAMASNTPLSSGSMRRLTIANGPISDNRTLSSCAAPPPILRSWSWRRIRRVMP